MNREDLEAIIEEVRAGRQEDTATEFKGSWWNFTVEASQKEFVRDVTALANANTKERRIIVVGLDASGALHDAPLPEDEAKLQQRLASINPHPTVSFTEIKLVDAGANKTLTVVEIQSPFNPPYVAKLNNAHHSVYLRRGSSIGTASRSELDRFYKGHERQAALRIGWREYPAGDPGDANEPAVLVIPPPDVTTAELKELVERARDQAIAAQATATHPEYPKLLEKYEQRCADAMRLIDDPVELGLWYKRKHWSRRRTISVLVHNEGTRPATNVRVRVDFPDTIRLYEGHQLAGREPKLFEIPPKPPRTRPPPARPPVEGALSALRQDLGFGGLDAIRPDRFSGLASMVNPISTPRPTSSIEYDEQKNRLDLWAADLTHTFTFGGRERFELFVLPCADGTELHAEVEYFCDEMEKWEQTTLPIRLDPSATPLEVDPTPGSSEEPSAG
ncbi:MAG: ATP-binding protein [Deltaproteobacteria bacterium]|nr:ATP-binding protein [Deltaproteobacteria bacterium]